MAGQERVDLLKTTLTGGGGYIFDGQELKINADISGNESWSGAKRVRSAKIAGNRLDLNTPLDPRPVDGKSARTAWIWGKRA